MKPGDRVLLNDGCVTLRALSNDGTAVQFDVVSGGPIGDQKGINLPGVRVSAPSMSQKDLEDLRAGLSAGVDYVALSFVRSADDVLALRERMGALRVPIIAKIEKPEAVHDIDAILDVANGIMVARGDLGVEMSLEMVPPIQKRLIRQARRRNRFVITATQMLESMIESANPTRAEVSDVANAIYDGSDAVMLSAETSVGKYPVEAVQYMARIAAEAERGLKRRGFTDLPHMVPDAGGLVRFRCGRRCGLHGGQGGERAGDRGLHDHGLQRAADFALSAAGENHCHDQFDGYGAAAAGELRRDADTGAGGDDDGWNAGADRHAAGAKRISECRGQSGVRGGAADWPGGFDKPDEAASRGRSTGEDSAARTDGGYGWPPAARECAGAGQSRGRSGGGDCGEFSELGTGCKRGRRVHDGGDLRPGGIRLERSGAASLVPRSIPRGIWRCCWTRPESGSRWCWWGILSAD